MRKFIFFITICLFLLGCATTPYQQQQQNKTISSFFREWNKAYQRQLDRQYYGRPQITFPYNYGQNYWQERYYQRKMLQP